MSVYLALVDPLCFGKCLLFVSHKYALHLARQSKYGSMKCVNPINSITHTCYYYCSLEPHRRLILVLYNNPNDPPGIVIVVVVLVVLYVAYS